MPRASFGVSCLNALGVLLVALSHLGISIQECEVACLPQRLSRCSMDKRWAQLEKVVEHYVDFFLFPSPFSYSVLSSPHSAQLCSSVFRNVSQGSGTASWNQIQAILQGCGQRTPGSMSLAPHREKRASQAPDTQTLKY